MKSHLYLLTLVFIFSCAPRPPSPPEPRVQATPEPATAIDGRWREIKNQRIPVKGKTWEFRGSSITIRDGSAIYSGTFSRNEDVEPKEIDFRFEDYPVNRGIYDLMGDVLTLKLLDTAAERATDIRYEDGYTLITCVREKVEEKEGNRTQE